MQRFLSEFRFSSASLNGPAATTSSGSSSAAAAAIPNGSSAPALQPQPLSSPVGPSGPKDLSASLPPPIRPPPPPQPTLSPQLSAMLSPSPATASIGMMSTPSQLQQQPVKPLMSAQPPPLFPSSASSPFGVMQMSPNPNLNSLASPVSIGTASSTLPTALSPASQMSLMSLMQQQAQPQQQSSAFQTSASANTKPDLSAFDTINAFNLIGAPAGNKQTSLSAAIGASKPISSPASQSDLSEFDAFQKSRSQLSPALVRQAAQSSAPGVPLAALQPQVMQQPQARLQPQPARANTGPTLQPITDIASRLTAAAGAQSLQSNMSGVQKSNAQNAAASANANILDDLLFS